MASGGGGGSALELEQQIAQTVQKDVETIGGLAHSVDVCIQLIGPSIQRVQLILSLEESRFQVIHVLLHPVHTAGQPLQAVQALSQSVQIRLKRVGFNIQQVQPGLRTDDRLRLSKVECAVDTADDQQGQERAKQRTHQRSDGQTGATTGPGGRGAFVGRARRRGC